MFSYYSQWWVVPILSTHAGAVLGVWVYYLAIGNMDMGHDSDSNSINTELHWSKDDTEDTEETDREGETDTEEAEQLPVKQDYAGYGKEATYVQVSRLLGQSYNMWQTQRIS